MKISRLAVDRLLQINWFSHVGDVVQQPDVRAVKNEYDFIKIINNIKWENTSLAAGNEMTGFLAKKFPNEYHYWNTLVRESKVILDSEIIPAMPEDVIANNIILNNVKWDLVNYLMESTYKDKLKCPLFFDSLICVYEAGHIPCGWEGEWPEGKLVVY
ncbi:hypothetical protein [Pectobacterium sp. B1J-3]|uniref:hypothetical protein n=1 Tax=Pectobacterium sp. B1J-3 TaxID=3385371 RepID=UPI0039060D46